MRKHFFRSFSDEESQIEVQMVEVLEEMKKLNVTFSTDTEGIRLSFI